MYNYIFEDKINAFLDKAQKEINFNSENADKQFKLDLKTEYSQATHDIAKDVERFRKAIEALKKINIDPQPVYDKIHEEIDTYIKNKFHNDRQHTTKQVTIDHGIVRFKAIPQKHTDLMLANVAQKLLKHGFEGKFIGHYQGNFYNQDTYRVLDPSADPKDKRVLLEIVAFKPIGKQYLTVVIGNHHENSDRRDANQIARREEVAALIKALKIIEPYLTKFGDLKN